MNQILPSVSQFELESPKKQLELIAQLINNQESGWQILREFLQTRQSATPDFVMGKIYQQLYNTNHPQNLDFLHTYFPQGIVTVFSERNIDYQPIQQSLIAANFQEADTLTRQKLWELAGDSATKRKWLYFTEVDQFPNQDLETINQLWLVYSEGKFGFSVQRKIWLSVGKNYNKLWPKIGWREDNKWTPYPHGFTWDLSAPVGHLPLSNQLRGVRVIASLFAHPVWQK